MLRRFLSVLSSLLIVAGLLLPAVQAFAYDFATGGWSVSSSSATYDFVNETTTITYTVSPGDAPHSLSHMSIETCHTSAVAVTGLSWVEKDGSLWDPNDPSLRIYNGPVFQHGAISKEIASTEITAVYDGLWKTESEKVYFKAGQDIYLGSALTIGCDPLTASFNITKTVSPDELTEDGTVTYTFGFENTGGLPLTITSAYDNLLDESLTEWVGQTVQPGGTLGPTTRTLALEVPDPGAEDDTADNTLTVKARFNDDPEITDTATASVNLVAPAVEGASFRITKTASPTSLDGGGSVTYTYTIFNNGSVDLDISAVSDLLDGEAVAEITTLFPAGTTIAADTELSKTRTVTFPRIPWSEGVTADVIDNVWTVTMSDDQGDLPAKTATATVTNNPLEQVNLSFMCHDTENDRLVWRAQNPNPVDLPFTWYVIGSPTISPDNGTGTALAGVGGNATDTLFYTNLPADPTQSITVGLAIDEVEQAQASSNTNPCVVAPPAPSLSVTKSASTTSITGSANVTYTYTITNTGNVPLTISSASDNKIAEIDVADFFPEQSAPYVLAVGSDPVTYSFTKLLVAGSTTYNEDNIFTVTATAPDTPEPLIASDTASVTVNPAPIFITFNPNPDFTVSKSVSATNDPATGQSSLSLTGGGTVYYFYTVTNTGNVSLVITQATDDKLGSVSFNPTVISPGGKATATLQKSFDAPALGSEPEVETNILSVSAVYDGSVVATKTASATVTNNPEPSGSITVRVLDNSPRNDGTPVAIAGASVSLSNGLTGTTDANGEIQFSGLPFGAYTADGTSADPTTGLDSQTGTGSATISTESPDEVINILLSWTPALAPPTPPPAVENPTGSITVRVFDGSPRNNGALQPIAGADVKLAGQSGKTDATGQITFKNLPFAAYTAFAESVDPLNPAGNDLQSGSGQTEISRAFPDETITIVLSWEPALASAAATTVPGTVAGRICAPRAPGAEIAATNAAGEQVKQFIAATGTLGIWMSFKLEGLAPGSWTLSLTNPGEEPVTQQVVVRSGETTAAADFSLACTGQPARGMNLPVYYLTGALLVLTGLLLRRYSSATA